MSEDSGSVEWVLEENEEKWREREREEMMRRSHISPNIPTSSNPTPQVVSVIGVDDQKLRDDEQDEKIKKMEEEINGKHEDSGKYNGNNGKTAKSFY